MRQCPVCSGTDAEELSVVRMRLPAGCALPEQYPILHCRTCGMCYAGTTASEQDYDSYYKDFNWYGGSGKHNTPVDVWADSVKKMVPADAAILDIGFGGGSFLLALKHDGYTDLHGIDPSPESVQALQAHGIEASVGSVYQLAPDKKFDLIILTGVIEHLLYPGRAIRQIIDCLTPEGRLFLTFPDYSAIAGSAFPTPHFFNQEHINYFSEQTLNRRMRSFSLFPEYREEIGGDREYNDYTAIYRRRPGAGPACGPAAPCESATVQAIRAHLHKAEAMLAVTRRTVRELAGKKERVWIWGCGANLGYLFANTDLAACRIGGLIDSNPLKRNWEVIPGLPAPTLPADAAMDPNDTVLITSMGGHEEIRRALRERGHCGPVLIL